MQHPVPAPPRPLQQLRKFPLWMSAGNKNYGASYKATFHFDYLFSYADTEGKDLLLLKHS